MIWFIGDTAVEQAAREFAGAEEFISTSTNGATPEQVWTEQKLFGRRRWIETVQVICFLPQNEYDSESTIWHLSSMTPDGTVCYYLYMVGALNVEEGLKHFVAYPNIIPISLITTTKREVLAKLNAARVPEAKNG